jgi:hypothetical protein
MKVELQDWKPEEGLETPTAQAEFLLAALEEKDPSFFAQSVAVVERARGCRKAGEIWDAIAIGLGAASKRSATRTARASHGTARRRELAAV